MLFRHGDVLISLVSEIPSSVKKFSGNILVRGEATGHAHRIEGNNNYQLYKDSEFLYLDVNNDQVTVVHEEHNPITLEKGYYKVWVQREYTPKEIRRVID